MTLILRNFKDNLVNSLKIATLGFAVLALTACSNTSNIQPSNILNTSIMADVQEYDNGVDVLINVEQVESKMVAKNRLVGAFTDNSFIVYLQGSGSCPPEIETVVLDKTANTINVALKPLENKPCTKDLRQYAYKTNVSVNVTQIDNVCIIGDCFKVVEEN